MNKYMIYRSPKKVDKDIKKHELIGVEYGEDIYDVTDAIIDMVTIDLSENPQYAKCEVFAYPPEIIESYDRTTRYQYDISGIVSPPYAEENIVVEYGIIEKECDRIEV